MKKNLIFNFLYLLLLANCTKSMNLESQEKEFEDKLEKSKKTRQENLQKLEQIEKELKDKYSFSERETALIETIRRSVEDFIKTCQEVEDEIKKSINKKRRTNKYKASLYLEQQYDAMIANELAQYEAEQRRFQSELEARRKAWAIEKEKRKAEQSEKTRQYEERRQLEANDEPIEKKLGDIKEENMSITKSTESTSEKANSKIKNEIETKGRAPQTTETIPKAKKSNTRLGAATRSNKKNIALICTITAISVILIYRYLNNKQKEE